MPHPSDNPATPHDRAPLPAGDRSPVRHPPVDALNTPAPRGLAARSPASYDAVREARVRAVGAAFLRHRPWIVAPGMALGAAAFALGGASGAQLRLLGPCMAAMLAYFVVEARRARRADFSERELFRSLGATAVGIGCGVALTGGLASPLLPVLFAPVVTTFAAFGRTRRSAAALAQFVALLALLGALPALLGRPWLPPPREPYRGAAAFVFAVTAAVLLLASVAGLSDAYRRAGEVLARLRDEALDEAAARVRGAEALGARVAHEVKNPLASIKGLVQLLARGAGDERSQRRFDVVAREVARIEELLREYLSFSRPLEDLALARVDVGALLDEVADVLEGRAGQAGVRLARAGAGAVIVADARRLKQAVLNLCTNALEATRPGGTVELVAEPLAGDGGARIVVRDAGRGMTPAELDRAGSAFYTTREGGTGLGVLLARAVVAQHGGALAYTSEPGVGTTAEVTLPSAPPPATTTTRGEAEGR